MGGCTITGGGCTVLLLLRRCACKCGREMEVVGGKRQERERRKGEGEA